jgi:hypothetical protein
LNFLCFVKINDVPSLLWLLASTDDQNSLTFFIFTILDLQAFASSSINVAEMVGFILEDLEPSAVGAPDLHVVCSTGRLDVP